MKVILFGFTGLGNAVLRGLLKTDNVNVLSVFTKTYSHPYPYYDEIQIEDFCKSKKIKCVSDVKINSDEIINLLKEAEPDLIIVSSFNQIISKQVIEIPKFGIINVHTSLLPKYRGPFPEQAVLLNEENETGVTVHYLYEKLDSGNILIQKSLNILSSDNHSTLKKKIADLSEQIIPDAIKLFDGKEKPACIKQNENDATFFPKPKREDGYLENETEINKIKNKVRALNPFPGTSISVNGKRIEVDEYEILKIYNNKEGIIESNNFIEVYVNSSGIRLFKKK